MTTRIIGTGSAVPERIVTNDYLSTIMDTSDEWISSRTGIRERRIAGEETTASMSIDAAKKALEQSNVRPEDIELVIVATCSPDTNFPSMACRVQGALGIERAAAFDLSAACSGFLFALHTAHAYLTAGMCKNALIVGAETLSRLVDWEDRGTCVLFGDGAGAAVVTTDDRGILATAQHADGSRGDVLECTDSISMNGQEVFKFAVKTVPECIHQVLDKGGCEKEEIKYYVLHQANRRIIQSVAKRMQMPEERFPVNLDRYGNTSAASIPILLDEMNRQGMLEKGDKLVMSGFGAGLTWGATLLEW